MGIIKTNYDTKKEIQFRGPIDESKRHRFGIGISKHKCIICGEKRNDVDDEGVCPDCNNEFPIKNNENEISTDSSKKEIIQKENIMNIYDKITKQLNDLISLFDENISDIYSRIESAAKEKDIDKIQTLTADVGFIKEIQSKAIGILDDVEDKFEPEIPQVQSITSDILIDPNNPMNLSFTKIVDAKFENESPRNWSNLLRTALILAIKKGVDINKIEFLTAINIKKGFYADEGYKYEPSIDLSYQELDANKSFGNVLILAKHLKIELMLRIFWRPRKKAQHPGKYGIINWKP